MLKWCLNDPNDLNDLNDPNEPNDPNDPNDLNDRMTGSFADDWPYGIFHKSSVVNVPEWPPDTFPDATAAVWPRHPQATALHRYHRQNHNLRTATAAAPATARGPGPRWAWWQVVTMVTMWCRWGRPRPCPPPASGPGPGPAAPPAGRGSTTRSTPAAACRSVHSAGCITVANLSVQNWVQKRNLWLDIHLTFSLDMDIAMMKDNCNTWCILHMMHTTTEEKASVCRHRFTIHETI